MQATSRTLIMERTGNQLWGTCWEQDWARETLKGSPPASEAQDDATVAMKIEWPLRVVPN